MAKKNTTKTRKSAKQVTPATLNWDRFAVSTPYDALNQFREAICYMSAYGLPEYEDLDATTRRQFEAILESGLLFEYLERCKDDMLRVGLNVPDDWLSLLCAATIKPRKPLDANDRENLGVIHRQVWAAMCRHRAATIETPARQDRSKGRPAGARDRQWLEWAEAIGLDTPNVAGLVRDKWNAIPDATREGFRPYHAKLPKGKTGWDRVTKGIKAAMKDREPKSER